MRFTIAKRLHARACRRDRGRGIVAAAAACGALVVADVSVSGDADRGMFGLAYDSGGNADVPYGAPRAPLGPGEPLPPAAPVAPNQPLPENYRPGDVEPYGVPADPPSARSRRDPSDERGEEWVPDDEW